MPVHQHRSRATKVLAVATLALVCAAFASEVQPASAKAKAKPKSRSKIIDLSAPTRYVLSISGNFTEKNGDAFDTGTIDAPFVFINIVQAGNDRLAMLEPGKANPNEPPHGKIVEQFFLQGTCERRGLVVLDLGVFPLTGVPIDVPKDTLSGLLSNEEATSEPTPDIPLEALTKYKPKNAPAGKVGFRVIGFPVIDEANKFMCDVKDADGRSVVKREMTLLGGWGVTTLVAAGELIFPVGGGTVVRGSQVNPTWNLTFVLKKA